MADHKKKATSQPGEPSPKQKLWLGRIRMAERHQSEHGNQSISGQDGAGRWDQFRAATAGDFNSLAELGEEAIDVNLVYANQKTTLPPLWLQEPYIAFTPTRARIKLEGAEVDNVRRAEFAETEVNYWMKELEFRTEILRPCVIDCENTNHGYCQVGFSTDKKDLEQDGESTEPNPLIRIKRPWLRRISPKNVLLPPGFYKLEHCEWIAIRWAKNWNDALKRYGKTEEQLKPTRSIKVDQNKGGEASDILREYLNSEDAKMVDIYEIWDKRNKKIIYIADGPENVLEEQDWTIENEGFPLVDMSFVDISDDYYGSPPTQYYFAQQKEQNALRTQMRRRNSRSKATIFVSAEISDDVIEEYKKSPDGQIIKTGLTGGEDIRNHIFLDTGLPPDQGALIYESRIKADAKEMSGESSNVRGAGDPDVETATESATIDKYVQIRATDKGDRVRSFTLSVARKLYMICRQMNKGETINRLIAGEIAGQFKDVTYTRKEIVGEFAMNLDVSSFINTNPQTRLASSVQLYNLFRADPLVNPEALVMDVYKAMNTPNPQQYLMFLRSPDEEFQLIMQGLPVEAHPQDKHEAHLQQHEAQMDQLSDMVNDENSNSDSGRKVRMVMAGMMMHINAHHQAIQQIAQKTGRQPGQPIDVNRFRNTQSINSGRETSAETGGSALSA